MLSYIPASIEWLVLRNHILERFKSVSLLPSRRKRIMTGNSTADGTKAVFRSLANLFEMNFLS
ncbi:hypothetical protein NC652_027008 [Populus alba x Populus x berolinensis]|nr:hypothetical protein NC652_027008 [Populus alba x Populus x berolinensis]